jgi:hypothetical protein
LLVLSHYLESRYAMRLILQHPGGVGYMLKERVSDLAVLTTRSAVCETASVSSTRRSSRGSSIEPARRAGSTSSPSASARCSP